MKPALAAATVSGRLLVKSSRKQPRINTRDIAPGSRHPEFQREKTTKMQTIAPAPMPQGLQSQVLPLPKLSPLLHQPVAAESNAAQQRSAL